MIYETLSILFDDKETEIVIRDATIWDAYQIADLYIEMSKEVDILGTEVDNIAKERFLLYILNQPIKIFVAECENDKNDNKKDNKIIGFIMGYTTNSHYETLKKRGLCEGWYCKPEYRKYKIGIKLKNYLEKFFENNTKVIEFFCKYDDNIIKRYIKMGYKPLIVKMIKINER